MTLLQEAAHPLRVTSLDRTAPEVQKQIAKGLETPLPPHLKLLYQQSWKGLRNLHEPFPTEWSQVYPPEGRSAYFELPFEEYERGENPWSLVGRRMVLDWGDKSDIITTGKGELRRWANDVVAKVDFSNDRKPIIQVKLGSNLQGSLRNLNDIFGAMASAHRKVVDDLRNDDLRNKGDSLSLGQLRTLQGS